MNVLRLEVSGKFMKKFSSHRRRRWRHSKFLRGFACTSEEKRVPVANKEQHWTLILDYRRRLKLESIHEFVKK